MQRNFTINNSGKPGVTQAQNVLDRKEEKTAVDGSRYFQNIIPKEIHVHINQLIPHNRNNLHNTNHYFYTLHNEYCTQKIFLKKCLALTDKNHKNELCKIISFLTFGLVNKIDESIESNEIIRYGINKQSSLGTEIYSEGIISFSGILKLLEFMGLCCVSIDDIAYLVKICTHKERGKLCYTNLAGKFIENLGGSTDGYHLSTLQNLLSSDFKPTSVAFNDYNTSLKKYLRIYFYMTDGYSGRCFSIKFDFKEMNLCGVTFLRPDIKEELQFVGADFTDTNLENTNWNCDGVSLVGAKFNRSNLKNANLQFLNASGADFTDADLRGANLKNIIACNANFSNAIIDDSTVLSLGFRLSFDLNDDMGGVSHYFSGCNSSILTTISSIKSDIKVELMENFIIWLQGGYNVRLMTTAPKYGDFDNANIIIYNDKLYHLPEDSMESAELILVNYTAGFNPQTIKEYLNNLQPNTYNYEHLLNQSFKFENPKDIDDSLDAIFDVLLKNTIYHKSLVILNFMLSSLENNELTYFNKDDIKTTLNIFSNIERDFLKEYIKTKIIQPAGGIQEADNNIEQSIILLIVARLFLSYKLRIDHSTSHIDEIENDMADYDNNLFEQAGELNPNIRDTLLELSKLDNSGNKLNGLIDLIESECKLSRQEV